jgi:competence protein ComEA
VRLRGLVLIGAGAAVVAAAVILRSGRPPNPPDAPPSAVATTPAGTMKVPRPVVTKAIDLNVAPVEDLETLPGITPDYARRIVAGRPYKSLEDVERTGVPREVLAHISPPATLVIKDGGGPESPPNPRRRPRP